MIDWSGIDLGFVDGRISPGLALDWKIGGMSVMCGRIGRRLAQSSRVGGFVGSSWIGIGLVNFSGIVLGLALNWHAIGMD